MAMPWGPRTRLIMGPQLPVLEKEALDIHLHPLPRHQEGQLLGKSAMSRLPAWIAHPEAQRMWRMGSHMERRGDSP
jgi:hypothetical protein